MRAALLCPWTHCPSSQTIFLHVGDSAAPAIPLTQVWGAPPTSPDAASSASAGALHSMLGAMDKRVSEEVRGVGSRWDMGHNQGGLQSVLRLQS